MKKENLRDRIFGIILEDGQLLYETLKSNPSKAMRAYRRLGLPPSKGSLAEFSMKRKRLAGDVRGLTPEQMKKKEIYIGPMR